jgi:uncharacterized protein (TIGR02452 family)
MYKLILSMFFLINFCFLSANNHYQMARIQDSEKHFQLVLDYLYATEKISEDSNYKIKGIIENTLKQQTNRTQFFYKEMDALVEKKCILEETSVILKSIWSDSFGYVFESNGLTAHEPASWMAIYRNNLKNTLELKKMRASIYEQTKTACIKGYKISTEANPEPISSQQLSWPLVEKMQNETVVFDKLTPLDFPGPYASTQIKVFDSDSLEVAQLLQKNGYHPLVLNFANKTKAGGGVIRGAQAQEEALFRRSSYYLGLDIKYNDVLHKKLKGKYLVPEFGAVYTPYVQIIRGTEKEGYPFIKAFEVDFVASAAYNLSSRDFDAPKNTLDYCKGMKEKMRTILRLSAITNHDAVVLGAFGCGAFKNNPAVVSKLFQEVIQEPEFQNHFRFIAFAILNGKKNDNYAIFHDVFKE